MTELRDAYHRACVELEVAARALQAAEAKFRTAQARCEEIESALGMTKLSTCPFPEAPKSRLIAPDARSTGPGLALLSLVASGVRILRRPPEWNAMAAGVMIAM